MFDIGLRLNLIRLSYECLLFVIDVLLLYYCDTKRLFSAAPTLLALAVFWEFIGGGNGD